jgi:hypothetical protein
VTGGIAGEASGLEAGAFGGQRLRQAYEAAIQPYFQQKRKTKAISQERERLLGALAVEPAYATGEAGQQGALLGLGRMDAEQRRALRRRLREGRRWRKGGIG